MSLLIDIVFLILWSNILFIWVGNVKFKQRAMHYDRVFDEIKSTASADIAHRKVFVRGLAWETSSDTLKNALSQFGEVEEGAVVFSKQTGKSRGFGFVTFAKMESAQQALAQQNLVIEVSTVDRLCR